jgi:hypothetical protein
VAATRSPRTPDEAFDDYLTRLATRGALVVDWPAARNLLRCHSNRWGPAEFYPGNASRFSPFLPVIATGRRASRRAEFVPVLYASDTEIGALSETVFRDLPVGGTKSIARSHLRRKNLSTLIVSRDLKLADLTSHGLARLRLRRQTTIESTRKQYWRTAQLARAVHSLPDKFDGMIWVSRQHDTSKGLVLFGDRVAATDIDTDPAVPTFPLEFGHGRDLVDEIADAVGITIVEP